MTGSIATPLEWTEETVTTFWDYWSNAPEAYFTEQFGAQIATLVGGYVAPGARVLDYGCGQGALIAHLLKRGFRTAGLDLSGRSVSQTRAHLAGRIGLEGIFSPAEIAGQTFDAVVLIEVIEHLDKSTRAMVLDAIHRLLVPGGVLIVTTPNAENLAAETVYCPCCRHTFHRWQHVQSFDGASLSAALSQGGFTAMATLETDFGQTGWNRPLARLKALARSWLKPDYRQPHLVGIARRSGGKAV